jgi:DNA-binding transcriptional regulator YiaG
MMPIQTIRKKRPVKASVFAEKYHVSQRTIYRWNSQTREDWLDDQRARRESVRTYHDDLEHTWPETARHFGVTESTVKQLAYRARKEHENESKNGANTDYANDVMA